MQLQELYAEIVILNMRRLAVVAPLAALIVLAGPTILAEAVARPTPTPTATPTPSTGPSPSHTPAPSTTVTASPGTLPVGSTRKNPLPTSLSAPALITVVPSTIDPQVANTLELFGRNLSGQTVVRIDSIAVSITQVQDATHVLVLVPGGALKEGDHDIILRNPNGESDDAIGALTARTPGIPMYIWVIAAGLGAALLLPRLLRWSTR